jgi:hypothetical protein
MMDRKRSSDLSGCFPTRFLEIQAYHYDSFKWSLFQFLQPIILLFFKFILWIWLTWSEQSLPSIHDGHHANETSFKGMIDGRSYSKITRICIRWAIQAEPSESLKHPEGWTVYHNTSIKDECIYIDFLLLNTIITRSFSMHI